MTRLVPPAPQPDFELPATPTPGEKTVNSASPKKLDLNFISRIYPTLLWSGSILSLCAAPLWGNAVAAGSFAGGIALAGLLLKAQELVFRRLGRVSRGQASAMAVLFIALAPLKLGVVIGLLWLLHNMGLIAPVP